jgi:hypothetical protein
MRRIVPAALVAIPLLYYFGLLVGAATYPGYSHATRYASELGAADAPYAGLFNYSIMLAGVAALAAAAGLPGAVHRLTGRRIWAILAAVALALWGLSMVMGGWFPMPDERHIAFGMGLAAPLVPLFALLALRGAPDAGAMRAFLAFIFVGQVVLLAIMFGAGELVTRANVGIWQRINSGFGIPWLAVLGIWMMRRRGRPGCGAVQA